MNTLFNSNGSPVRENGDCSTGSANSRSRLLHHRRTLLSLALAAAAACATTALAEEGGGGHYAPGGAASFADALPGKPALAVANYFMFYDASASASRTLPFGGLIAADLQTRAYADTVLALYETPLKLLGGNYAVGLALPYVWLDVDGKVTGPLGNTLQTHDTANGFGDLTFYPFMLGWAKGDLKADVRLGIYAPSGDYEKGQLANVGKNYWTFEPMVSVSWFSSKIGLEATAFAGLDFSTKNEATDYQSGDVFHLDATVAEHLPLGKHAVIGVGANAFYYQQITGDSGSGAVFGGFEGRTVGVGPVVSLITKVCGKDLVAEVKWLPELDVDKRVKGDMVWVKLGMAF